MSEWAPHLLKESALQQVEAQLTKDPASLPLHYEKARLLTELGRVEEAKQIYLKIISADETQFVALNNLGNLLHETGHRTAALRAYRHAVKHHPENVTGHVNLAHALAMAGELEEARASYESALRIDPAHIGAHQGLSYLLMDLMEEEAAWEHRQKGFGNQPLTTFRYRGEKEPVRILLLISPSGGNAPIQRHLDRRVFLTTQVVTDFYDPSIPLPPHQLVINSIGDADRSQASLAAAERVLAQTTAPLLNPPERIAPTGRAENARRLGALEGVITPRITFLPRTALAGADALSILEQQGFTLPVLLRTPGFHGGEHFVRVNTREELAAALPTLPGDELAVIEYLDARDADGKIRKYRVMMIDGKIYPLHAAVSPDWKIHYFSAEMVNHPAHQAEDAAFLEDMPRALGPRAMRALEKIEATLGLDYGGADFSLSPDGDVFLFEANATMAIVRPQKEAQWDYRRPAVQRVQDAVRQMLLRKAGV